MSFAENYHRWILDEFYPFLGQNVAEVGAGIGDFSKFLIEAKIESLVAFEPSSKMYQSLGEKFETHTQVQTINGFFDEKAIQSQNKFNSICYVNVLEHIEDDKKTLADAYQALAPQGHVLIFVPALAFLFSEQDKIVGHFRRYSKMDLFDKVTGAGFHIKELKYFDIFGIIPWYLAFVLLKQKAKPSNVSIYDKIVVPIGRKLEQFIPPPIGKNLILVGQKR